MTIADRWQRYFFSPERPENLAICRILFYAIVLYLYATVPFAGWATLLKETSFYHPVSLLKLLHLPIVSDQALGVLGWVWKSAMLLSCIGLLTRISTVIAFFSGAYLLAVQNSDGKVEHQTAMLVFAMGILALSRCGDAYSVDTVLFNRSRRPVASSGEYRWPVRAVWVLMSMVFFAAGIAKLRASGIRWATGQGFGLLLIRGFYDANPPLVNWGLFIANHALLAKLMAGSSLALETLFPLALFDRRLRFIFPASAFFMQIGIGLLMSVWFLQYLPIYIFWVPWDCLISRREKRLLPASVDATATL